MSAVCRIVITLIATKTMVYTSDVEKLLVAIIVQAASDFVDSYLVGLIDEETNRPNIPAIHRRILVNRRERHTFPRWMSSNDVLSSSYFLFCPGILEGIIPSSWDVDADTIREGIIKTAKRGERMHHNFCYGG